MLGTNKFVFVHRHKVGPICDQNLVLTNSKSRRLLLTLDTVCLLQVGCGGLGCPWSGAHAAATLLWKLPGRVHLAPEPAVSKSVMQGKPRGLSLKLLSHLSPQSPKMLQQQLWSVTYRVKVSNALGGCLSPSSAALYRQKRIHVKLTHC